MRSSIGRRSRSTRCAASRSTRSRSTRSRSTVREMGTNASVAIAWLLVALPCGARADEPPATAEVKSAPSIEERLRALEEDNARLQENLKLLREDHEQAAERLAK